MPTERIISEQTDMTLKDQVSEIWFLKAHGEGKYTVPRVFAGAVAKSEALGAVKSSNSYALALFGFAAFGPRKKHGSEELALPT